MALVHAAVILDSDGNRLCAKYYSQGLKANQSQVREPASRSARPVLG